MIKGKENFKNELIKKYKEYQEQNDNSVCPFACIARDEMRKIREVFEKNFHESIDLYL